MSTSAGIHLREKQEPVELWLMIWKFVGQKIEKDHKDPRLLRGPGGLQEPFGSHRHPQLLEDPQRRQQKVTFAASFSLALAVFGPELYERVFVITEGAMKSLLHCAIKDTLHPFEPLCCTRWITHLDLILSDKQVQKVDWKSTCHVWGSLSHLQTLTLCYHPKEPALLVPYLPITEYLPQSLQLLRLRPWGEADDIPPRFLQILRGGAKGRVLPPRRDFWWAKSWALQVQAFQNVPHIHLQAVVYVVWPPYSQNAARKTFRRWTAQVEEGRLRNLSVTLFPPDEGEDIQSVVEELEGDIDLGKRYGYILQAAEDPDDALERACYPPGGILAYDWKKDEEGHWQVDMAGDTARMWARQYGCFSYLVAEKLDGRLDWGWFSSM